MTRILDLTWLLWLFLVGFLFYFYGFALLYWVGYDLSIIAFFIFLGIFFLFKF